MRFAYVTRVERKQTKDINDIGPGAASYKVLPLGNNVFLWTVHDFLSATPTTLLIPLPFTCNGRRTHRFIPMSVQRFIVCHHRTKYLQRAPEFVLESSYESGRGEFRPQT